MSTPLTDAERAALAWAELEEDIRRARLAAWDTGRDAAAQRANEIAIRLRDEEAKVLVGATPVDRWLAHGRVQGAELVRDAIRLLNPPGEGAP